MYHMSLLNNTFSNFIQTLFTNTSHISEPDATCSTCTGLDDWVPYSHEHETISPVEHFLFMPKVSTTMWHNVLRLFHNTDNCIVVEMFGMKKVCDW